MMKNRVEITSDSTISARAMTVGWKNRDKKTTDNSTTLRSKERRIMFDIGGGELMLILLAVLIFFGPKKIPELAKSLGKGIREFKRAQQQFTDQINTAINEEDRRQRYSSEPTYLEPEQSFSIAPQQSASLSPPFAPEQQVHTASSELVHDPSQQSLFESASKSVSNGDAGQKPDHVG